MKPPVVVIPIGPPGCGKSTLANALVGQNTERIVSPDHYRRILTGNKGDQSANTAAFQICRTILNERVARGLDVLFDATNIGGAALALARVATQAGAHVVSIVMETSDDVLRVRNMIRPEGEGVPDEVLERMITRFRAMTRFPGIVLTPEEALAAVTHGALWTANG
jgi:predicted kinase